METNNNGYDKIFEEIKSLTKKGLFPAAKPIEVKQGFYFIPVVFENINGDTIVHEKNEDYTDREKFMMGSYHSALVESIGIANDIWLNK